MKWKAVRLIVIASAVLILVGCAHRQHVRSGDAYMQAGAYEQALIQYRTAQEKKPRSSSIAAKVDEAEDLVLERAMRDIEAALADDEVEYAFDRAAYANSLLQDPDRLNRLEANLERVVLRRARAHLNDEEYSRALWWLDEHVSVFGDPLEPVAELEEEIITQWQRELRRQARGHFDGGRHGAAALYFGKADFLGGVGDGGSSAAEAVRRVQHFDGWGVSISSNVDAASLSRIANQTFTFEFPQSVVDARHSDSYGLDALLQVTITDPEFTDWEEREMRSGEFQSGTRLVPNPEYEREYARLAEAEDGIEEAGLRFNEARHELREAERDLRQRQREGRATASAERRVDRAFSQLDRREIELEEAEMEANRINARLRQIDRQLEEPVFSDHYYEVTLQRARMTTDVRLELTVPAREFEHIVEFEVVEDVQTVRHTAQPVLNLSGRSEAPPSQRHARSELDRRLGEEAARFILDSFGHYRVQSLGDLSQVSERDRIDRLARFILLDPFDSNPDYEADLDELTGFVESAEVLFQLTQEEPELQ